MLVTQLCLTLQLHGLNNGDALVHGILPGTFLSGVAAFTPDRFRPRIVLPPIVEVVLYCLRH